MGNRERLSLKRRDRCCKVIAEAEPVELLFVR